MKIVIAGAGVIGGSVAEALAEEGHDLTVIDCDPAIVMHTSNSLDVSCVEGNAADPELLREAGAAEADLVVAATEKDEVNMVCGIIARKMGAGHVIARIRDPLYLSQTKFLREALGLSQIVNPEYECARQISRILRFPSAARVVTFSKGSLEIVEHRIAEGTALCGLRISDMGKRFRANVLVALIERAGQSLIPNGDTVLCAGDRLSITGASSDLRRFFIEIGEYRKPVRRVMIMGGSTTSVYLTRLLQENSIDVTIVERDRRRCEQLCDLVPEAHVVCGDATHSDVLLEDGILTADAFVSLTGDDGDNIITSLYARSCNVGKVVTKINREHFADVLSDSGLDSIVSPKELVAQQLARYARALGNSAGSSVETLYRVSDGKIEILEFGVEEDAACVRIPLRDLKLRDNVLVAALIRGNKSIRPDGDTRILPGDHAVIVTAHRLRTLDDMLEEKP